MVVSTTVELTTGVFGALHATHTSAKSGVERRSHFMIFEDLSSCEDDIFLLPVFCNSSPSAKIPRLVFYVDSIILDLHKTQNSVTNSNFQLLSGKKSRILL